MASGRHPARAGQGRPAKLLFPASRNVATDAPQYHERRGPGPGPWFTMGTAKRGRACRKKVRESVMFAASECYIVGCWKRTRSKLRSRSSSPLPRFRGCDVVWEEVEDELPHFGCVWRVGSEGPRGGQRSALLKRSLQQFRANCCLEKKKRKNNITSTINWRYRSDRFLTKSAGRIALRKQPSRHHRTLDATAG